MLLLADDDADILRVMEFHLRSWGYQVATARDKIDLFRQLDTNEPMTLLLDLFFGEDNGIEVLTEIRERFPDLPVLILTGHGSIESAVRAMRQGAYDFLTKPPDFDRLRLILKHTVERHDLRKRVKKLEEIAEFPYLTGQILGHHDSIRRLTTMIKNVASTDATVLILGETGSGKELIARALHSNSPRKETGPFIPINMAALPADLAESTLFGHEKGAFTGAAQSRLGCCEAAKGGTLFLDEIGEMDLVLQSKLLRFLQDKTLTRVGSNLPISVDVRVVAATNQNLQQLVRQGKFREDLYYRLNVISICSPPLRERQEDIPVLASLFLQKFALKYRKDPRKFDENSLRILFQYEWPGNIRQLENLIERLVVLGRDELITLAELPSEFFAVGTSSPSNSLSTGASKAETANTEKSPDATPDKMEEIEKQAILIALARTKGNVRETARQLGISPATVYRKMKFYNISLKRILE